MPDFAELFKGLGDAVLADIKATGEAFWNDLQEDQKPIVERAARRAAELSALLITDPANADRHKRSLTFVWATLQAEAAVTAFRAEREIRQAIGRNIMRVANLILGLI